MPIMARSEAVETAAMAAFEREDGAGREPFGEIAILIPAYKEAANIEAVLREIPETILGLRRTILVIRDGPEDGTTERARALGARVATTGGHRGQGAALRIGYRIAVAHGSAYLVSLDADGQYPAAEIATVLEPLVAGQADFVSGSRRLGTDRTTDRVRALGVDVFAAVISVLTGHTVTDPAFGLRAMRAAVAEAVTLEQSQYQASELLISAIRKGFRVTERPATMRIRAAEKSRKGPNFLYGYRFGRVVLRTWWRER